MVIWVILAVNSVAQPAASTKIEQVNASNNLDNSGSSPGLVTNLLVSFFGGGAAVGIISLLYKVRQDRRNRRVEFIDSQLRNLYGPLQFFVSCSQNIYKHTWIIQQASHEEYGGENWQKHNDQARSDGIKASIDVNNEYFVMTRANNDRMVEILTNNYALIEPDDAEIFAGFHTHYLRGKTEFDKSQHLKLPLEVYTNVGDVYCLQPEFAQLVNRRFLEKKAELERLLR